MISCGQKKHDCNYMKVKGVTDSMVTFQEFFQILPGCSKVTSDSNDSKEYTVCLRCVRKRKVL